MVNNTRPVHEFSVFFLISTRSPINVQCTNRIETNIIREKAETLAFTITAYRKIDFFSRNRSSQFKKISFH